MIRPLNSTDLASTKTRSGMNSLADLIPRLIRSYELQAELMQRRAELAEAQSVSGGTTGTATQATFNWYD